MTTILSGGRIVLHDSMLDPGSIVLDDGLITDLRSGTIDRTGDDWHDVRGHLLVPGFIDVHVHGVEGVDTLATADAVAKLAARFPRYGVTGFCPTTVGCPPLALRRLLDGIRKARTDAVPGHAAVHPAHLESNFINPEFRGAQPVDCIRLPNADVRPGVKGDVSFSGQEILDEIARARDEVGILTIAPELDGTLDLIRALTAAGHIVSLGHSGATFEQGLAGVDAGARHATHLFNRMPPFFHRAPGLIGAIFERQEICAEIVCDGYHVHPIVARTAIRTLGRSRTMAITDGTAAAGLPVGTMVPLGSHTIRAAQEAAFLDDGTLAGSTLTMDAAFRNAMRLFRLSEVDAAHLCATTPARQLGLTDRGRLAVGQRADLAVLDQQLAVRATFVAGVQWRSAHSASEET
jgi:N-acetylglucosamine-6-phosphate deacetylase